MPKVTSKKFLKHSALAKGAERKGSRKLPNWVDLGCRGLFKDEITPSDAEEAVSWIASWKPCINPVNLSYVKKIGDYEEEYVCKSKTWLAAKNGPYPKMRCIICKKKYIFPSYVNFCYKYDESLNAEKISEIQKVACSYHWMSKGVNNDRKLHIRKAKKDYKEEDDFDETSFDVDYNEFVNEKELMGEQNND